ncbi:Lrp/AsnC family transcriptional regulator [Shimia sp. SDUM112013]|uniref:Lrp/AsnC family transcriptional regulator n=1 Tax=Shimia sp. SDUM112013 TaxID=3136160 RepID=UPI0032EFF4D2
MDETDRAILKLVQGNARLTADAISAEVGLSAPAVQKRLQKLRKSGAIEREIAVLNPGMMGSPMTIITEVLLERESRAQLDAFKRRMRSAPCVQQCYYTTGESDFVLILTVRDIHEYEKFTQTYFFDNSNISRFKTAVVMDRVKVSLDVI